MHLITDQSSTSRVMKRLPNFSITAQTTFSSFFTERNLGDFFSVIRYLRTLPTREGAHHPLEEVAADGGSCNAKNGLLAVLARENNRPAIRLTLCTYTVDYRTNPILRCMLDQYGLPALPEVSCYLKYQGAFYTVAKESLAVTHPVISDIEITPQQTGSFTRRYYHHFVEHWLQLEKLPPEWTVERIKQVRQACLQATGKQHWQLIHSPFEA